MNLQGVGKTVVHRAKQRPVVAGLIGVALVVLLTMFFMRSGSPTQASTYYEVKRGDFLISIVEGGTLEAVDEVSIRNEVEGTARIIFIVPEGSYVKKGDLLVELDSSASQDVVNQQQIAVEKAQFTLIQAEQQLGIQKSTADSDVQAALLKVEFAATDLDKYIKGEALQLRRNAQIEITNVLESLRIAEDRLKWSEELYKQGFETKSNLDKDKLAVSQSSLKLEQAEKALWMLATFDEKKKKRELEAARQAAEENLERVKLQGERVMAQYRADVETQKSTLELSRAKLERDMKQLRATKIYAPQDGLVVYSSGGGGGGRFSNESMIEEGAVVRNRQELIKLPDVSEMKLQVRIHESHINQVRLGQQAFVVLDSMPDQRLRGEVNKVGLLPDGSSRWGNPNLKVYATEILITDKLPDVKPGVSARAEIVITNLGNVLTVPIQAVSTRKGQQVIFLASAPQRPVPVNVGMYNTKFIEISSGLRDHDQVLLAPPFDPDEKDLGGAILADGEVIPPGATNHVLRPSARVRESNERRSSERRVPLGEAPPESTSSRGGERGGPPSVAAAAGAGERDPRRMGRRGGAAGEGGGGGTNRMEMFKRFDTNGDGQLDETEKAAMRERFKGDRSRSTALTDPVAN
jgi:HlyD family secretion protein